MVLFHDPAIRYLAVGQTLVWAGIYYIFPAMLLHWEADLGWSRSDLTLAITLAILASAVAAPLAGRIIDLGNGHVQMGIAAGCAGAAIAALSMVEQLWQFYVVWVFVGVMQAGCLYEPCFALVTRTRDGRARSGITAITLVAGFAGTVSFPMVHVLVTIFGWRLACLMIGTFVLFVVAPLLWRGAGLLGQVDPTNRPNVRAKILGRPVFWMLGTGFAILALVHGALLHHLLPILAERNVSPGEAVFAAACIGPMQVIGRLAMVATERHFSAHGFALAAFGTMGIAAACLLLAGANLVMLAIFVALFGSAYGTISILRPVIARELLGVENFGAKSGALALLYLTASAASAYLGSLIWAAAGYEVMMGVLIALLALGAFLNVAARRIGEG